MEGIPPYTPILPLEVVAAEVGLQVDALIKIDANENTYGPVEEIKRAIASYPYNNIYPDPGTWVLLPQPQPPGQATLREALGKEFNVPSSMIVAGTGADDLLQLFVTLTQGTVTSEHRSSKLERPIVSSEPTFGMYSFLASVANRKYVNAPRDNNLQVSLSCTYPLINEKGRFRVLAQYRPC